mmetsp:Transcript_38503/g.86454  ORF Transcript_38503/g.86454 Transcript_38503/m.86454 type:complete len:191 (+) Transcript_38503:498-1070(+)
MPIDELNPATVIRLALDHLEVELIWISVAGSFRKLQFLLLLLLVVAGSKLPVTFLLQETQMSTASGLCAFLVNPATYEVPEVVFLTHDEDNHERAKLYARAAISLASTPSCSQGIHSLQIMQPNWCCKRAAITSVISWTNFRSLNQLCRTTVDKGAENRVALPTATAADHRGCTTWSQHLFNPCGSSLRK